jgi:hypothetical protein
MGRRYDIQRGREGLWRVIDRFTGQVVVEKGIPLDHLRAEDADDMVDFLNLRDLNDRKARGIV